MSGPALFAAPIEAETVSGGLPVLILGITELFEAFVVTDEGRFGAEPLTNLSVNWRYNWRDHSWVETGDMNGAQDDPPDGGSDLSGSVPDTDGVGASDPLNPEGRQTTGDPGDLDTGATQ